MFFCTVLDSFYLAVNRTFESPGSLSCCRNSVLHVYMISRNQIMRHFRNRDINLVGKLQQILELNDF